jgi:hypothetical protein
MRLDQIGLGGLGEGIVGLDGGIELAHSPEVQTVKNNKTEQEKNK